ncbi:hypothetical protein JHK86_016480 [Glycine max]|nr:hypothetical protein JHK86_016480 [Glycine max]
MNTALGCEEHPGCVRVAGHGVTISSYFEQHSSASNSSTPTITPYQLVEIIAPVQSPNPNVLVARVSTKESCAKSAANVVVRDPCAVQTLLTNIGSRFVTLPEERLLAVVNALLHRCYKYPTATIAEVPQSLKKELLGVCRACVSIDAVNMHVDFKIAPDHTVKLDRVAADIPIVRRHGSSFRRLTLIGFDGSQRHFIVQTSLTPNARTDERILQLFPYLKLTILKA